MPSLFLECEVDRIIDGFGDNSLICGRIVVAHAYRERAIRHEDVDDQDVIAGAPLLVYVSPGTLRAHRDDQLFSVPEGHGPLGRWRKMTGPPEHDER